MWQEETKAAMLVNRTTTNHFPELAWKMSSVQREEKRFCSCQPIAAVTSVANQQLMGISYETKRYSKGSGKEWQARQYTCNWLDHTMLDTTLACQL